MIQGARDQALRAADQIQVHTCWHVGCHIVEFEQGGAVRTAYGKRLLADLAARLTAEFGKGFDERNLRHMRSFYRKFDNWNALRSELSWTHCCALLRLENDEARQWHMNEAADQHDSARPLDRQISTLCCERLLASQDRATVPREAAARTAELFCTPREFIRDPVILEAVLRVERYFHPHPMVQRKMETLLRLKFQRFNPEAMWA